MTKGLRIEKYFIFLQTKIRIETWRKIGIRFRIDY